MTLKEYAQAFKKANPSNKPVSLWYLANLFFPGDKRTKPATHHNGGCTKIEYITAGIMGRMMKKGYVSRPFGWKPSEDVSLWVWKGCQHDVAGLEKPK